MDMKMNHEDDDDEKNRKIQGQSHDCDILKSVL